MKTILSAFAVVFTTSVAMAAVAEENALPTVEEIEEAWNATYKIPYSKWGSLPRFSGASGCIAQIRMFCKR